MNGTLIKNLTDMKDTNKIEIEWKKNIINVI
jgi:hypothetical protein